MEREVVFAPEARDDLLELYDYIAGQAGAARARAYTGRIVSYCPGFTMFSERGRRRDDLRPGLRVIGFGRRVTIAYHTAGDRIHRSRPLRRPRSDASTPHPRRGVSALYRVVGITSWALARMPESRRAVIVLRERMKAHTLRAVNHHVADSERFWPPNTKAGVHRAAAPICPDC